LFEKQLLTLKRKFFSSLLPNRKVFFVLKEVPLLLFKQLIKNYVRFPYNVVQNSLNMEYIQVNKLTNMFKF
jgi:hypothetical protein